MGKVVTKFGGSSLADAQQFAKVRDILLMDSQRRYVVPSAPGRRFPEDDKVTDLLYQCHRQASAGEDFQPTFDLIAARYMDIAEELGLKVDLGAALDEVNEKIAAGANADYCASRGEYLNGLLLADYMGWRFVDAAQAVRFDDKGAFQPELTNELMAKCLADGEPAVIPGFYGAKADGSVVTFSRGGSDITGAIVARAVGADVYENWTDVSGFLMADPRIVKNPREISAITYKELRELSYMGASVLHEDAMFPVHKAGIPTNIRNTNRPEHPGTIISVNLPHNSDQPTITGIAGHKGFTVISVEKAMMNNELGFGRRMLGVLEEYGISFEHLPTGIDTMCAVVSSESLAPCRDQVISRIIELTEPDTITVHENMSIIATVGRGMVHNCGTAARLFSAMSQAGINVRMIDQGSSELSIIVGVDDKDFEATIQAIYGAFVL
ncbi:MAG: aspartate kinase [Christensenellaceae bacterium]|nr:aspartate kinase [Christensenellaceae bacterium]